MPFDNNKVYRPDFYANGELPRWQPMGQDDQDMGAQAGAIGNAFKQRFMKPPAPMGHEDTGHGEMPSMAPHEMGAPMGGEHGMDLMKKLGGGAGGGGGMESL